MDMSTLVDLRKSVRNFTDKDLDKNKLQELEDFFTTCKKLDEDIKTEIKIVKKDSLPDKIEEIGGYNGYLIDAPYYILIFSENKPYFIENAGYIGEDIILKMTDMGIDSCWLTLKQEKVIDEHEGMRITGLIAVGYGGKYKKPDKMQTDNEIRMDILDMVYMNKYGNSPDLEELFSSGIAEGFYAARRAPSALNRQPWRFILDNDVVVLVIKKDEYTNVYDAKIAAGAAMFNFAAVISERYFTVKWNLGDINREYEIPNDCVIVAYCGV